jgi:hypothetical protein
MIRAIGWMLVVGGASVYWWYADHRWLNGLWEWWSDPAGGMLPERKTADCMLEKKRQHIARKHASRTESPFKIYENIVYAKGAVPYKTISLDEHGHTQTRIHYTGGG